MTELKCLVGKTLTSVTKNEYGDVLRFVTSDGDEYEMSHSQDCCESVSIESITGSLEDLVGVPIKMAEEAISQDGPDGTDYSYESCTWTFYKFATIKGYVDIRWLGVSNGYYSEGVDFSLVKCGDAWHVNHQTGPNKCPRCGNYSRLAS